jgi:hypothetical protein
LWDQIAKVKNRLIELDEEGSIWIQQEAGIPESANYASAQFEKS